MLMSTCTDHRAPPSLPNTYNLLWMFSFLHWDRFFRPPLKILETEVADKVARSIKQPLITLWKPLQPTTCLQYGSQVSDYFKIDCQTSVNVNEFSFLYQKFQRRSPLPGIYLPSSSPSHLAAWLSLYWWARVKPVGFDFRFHASSIKTLATHPFILGFSDCNRDRRVSIDLAKIRSNEDGQQGLEPLFSDQDTDIGDSCKEKDQT